MKSFMNIVRKDTRELALELNGQTEHHGDESWLFLPAQVEGRVCLVAHIDTVFDRHPKIGKTDCLTDIAPKKKNKKIFFDNKKGVMWSPEGLGADDRAGVWASLNLFKSMPEPFKPIVLLTDGEETGGSGAREAAEIFGETLEKASFFVELDRKGRGEAVFYNWEPDIFVDYIKSFGFNQHNGSFSDISFICPGVQRCGVNLSVGYHNAHSPTEYLNLKELKYTTEKVMEILKDNHERKRIWELGYKNPFLDDWHGALDCPKCDSWLMWSDLESGICPMCGADITQMRDAVLKETVIDDDYSIFF